jgi:uncharacterized protein YegP (UPF0339 family)
MRAVRGVGLAVLFAGLLGLTGEAVVAQDSKLKFELYKDKGGEFRWRLKAANGAILATPGQGYKDKADAKHGIEIVQKSGASDSKAKFELYEDTKKETRWRLKASNGQVVASSSEGYKAKADAEKAVELVKTGAAKAEVVEVDEKDKKDK